MIAAASLIPTWGDRLSAIAFLILWPCIVYGLLRWASRPHPRNRKDNHEYRP